MKNFDKHIKVVLSSMRTDIASTGFGALGLLFMRLRLYQMRHQEVKEDSALYSNID